jgi:hypothetical protein
MRGQAMKRLCSNLHEAGIDISSSNALEFFARDGRWQTTAYANKVKSLDAWEIDPIFEEDLRKALPKANITIGDSFTLSQDKSIHQSYDLIVFDNPQGIYGNEQQYCEHFECLELVNTLIKDSGLLIFNVNRAPFNFSQQNAWQGRRSQFYNTVDTSELSHDFLQNHYTSYFTKLGFHTDKFLIEKRNEEYLTYFAFYLKKM